MIDGADKHLNEGEVQMMELHQENGLRPNVMPAANVKNQPRALPRNCVEARKVIPMQLTWETLRRNGARG